MIERTLEPAEVGDLAPAMGPSASDSLSATAPPARYWQAQGLVEALLAEFEAAHAGGRRHVKLENFFILARYYGRTLAILRSGLARRRESLVVAALRNLIALHQGLHRMHRIDPDTVPGILVMDRTVRARLLEDLIVEILQESERELDVATITERVNDLDILADARPAVVERHLANLISTGHVQIHGADGHFRRTGRGYATVNWDEAGLHNLLGEDLVGKLDAAGFRGLSDITDRPIEFQSTVRELLGFAPGTAALLVSAAELIAAASTATMETQTWRHADLINSPYPRPYQYEAYAIFRGHGYQGEVIEAPTGSGKTMIGMMCIQDWLRSLSQGQTILVLVPTVNYQQQWVSELCFKPIGLRLSPHLVFTGTPSSLEAVRARTPIAPAVIIMTYAALAQAGSGIGKGGFDRDSIEIFLQGNNVQFVIFDEVHKVVEDLQSVSADVTRVITEWLRDGSLRGAIGFSGTAAPFRPRLAQLGLRLAHVMPAAELIAYGFVAPFAEFGIPFAYSDREQQIRELLDAYKARVREFVALIGVEQLRTWFAAIPLEERIAIARDLLRMYAGEPDREALIATRLRSWETGQDLPLPQLPLVTMVQLARDWSDEELVRQSLEARPETVADGELEQFRRLLEACDQLRQKLKALIFLPDTVRRLDAPGFGTTFDAPALRRLMGEHRALAARAEAVRDGLATTIVGLYDVLSDWYLRVGEGRVASIKAIVAAERASRPVTGVIIFDKASRIHWQAQGHGQGQAQAQGQGQGQGAPSVPGYTGVAGDFSELLGDDRFVPMAVLSSEIYLPYSQDDPLPRRIAAYIREAIMVRELGEAFFALAVDELGLADEERQELRASFDELLARFVEQARDPAVVRLTQFSKRVLTPFRRGIRRAAEDPRQRDRALAGLSLKHYHVRDWVGTLFDYAVISDAFDHARVAELRQVSGQRQRFFVVPMASGDRKQLMYDLTARVVDEPELPVNLIIVSSWARTGWNVITPNVLIDATATRNVTAWQQLRGRAMRARRTWTNECYRIVLLLMGSRPLGFGEDEDLPEDAAAVLHDLLPRFQVPERLDDAARSMLLDAHRQYVADANGGIDAAAARLGEKIERGVIRDFTVEEREQLVTALMLARNKVTHIYELVRAYGSAPQIHLNRATRSWERMEAIAAKHLREYSVNPITGVYSSGPEHAPLIYAGDPRKDVPSELSRTLRGTLEGSAPTIVRGWLRGIATGVDESDAVE